MLRDLYLRVQFSFGNDDMYLHKTGGTWQRFNPDWE